MGHANLSNISNFFLRRLYAKGKLSISDCVKAMVEKGETVHASEGYLEDEYMLAYATEEIVSFLIGVNGKHYYPPQEDEILMPVSLSEEQKPIFEQWKTDGAHQDWDNPQYEILDSIEWKFSPGWRKRYPDIPMVDYFSN